MLPPSAFADAPADADQPSPGLNLDQAAMAQGGGAAKLLGAVSTLLALTPRGRADELTRLTALAHGYIALASEDDLVTLAKAVANRDDVSNGLADRLAETSLRAAHTLIRANRLSEEAIAYLLERGDESLRALIAKHHTLQPKHVTMLVADGNTQVLSALLNNRQTDLSQDTKASLHQRMNAEEMPATEQPSTAVRRNPAVATLTPALPEGFVSGDPRISAETFADLDGAGRRAIVRRMSEDAPAPKTTSMARARRALDPTRNDADLAFLTVIEQRDNANLAALFASTLKLDTQLVSRMVDEADGDALLVLAKAAGLSSTAFARMLILGKVGLTGSPRDTFALVDRFKALPEATAQMIVGAMQTGSKPEQSTQPTTRRAPAAPVAPEQGASRSILSLAANKPVGFRRAG